jgi:hypothetical protein
MSETGRVLPPQMRSSAGFRMSIEPAVLVLAAPSATMRKPTQPGAGGLLVLESTGSKQAIGASQVGVCLGTYVQRRLASRVELSAQSENCDWHGQMRVAVRKEGAHPIWLRAQSEIRPARRGRQFSLFVGAEAATLSWEALHRPSFWRESHHTLDAPGWSRFPSSGR